MKETAKFVETSEVDTTPRVAKAMPPNVAFARVPQSRRAGRKDSTKTGA